MQFDEASSPSSYWGRCRDFTAFNTKNAETLLEGISKEWEKAGFKMPHLIFWNVNAVKNDIPMSLDSGRISYVSGFSPSIFDAIMSGKDGISLMYEKLDSERYSCIK